MESKRYNLKYVTREGTGGAGFIVNMSVLKKPLKGIIYDWLFRVYQENNYYWGYITGCLRYFSGMKFTTQVWEDCFLIHGKDPYQTPRI